MPSPLPDYIDNQHHKLSAVLSRLIRDYEQDEAAFASGYFEPNVWGIIGADLARLQRFRLLLGRQPEIALPTHDLVDLRAYYRHKIQGDLELLRYNPAHVQMIEDLLAFLARSSVEVRLFEGRFLHAKAYIFPHYAIVGSSNFTPAGLGNNSELDLVTSVKAVAQDLLHNWYDAQWARSSDYKAELTAVLEASKFGNRPWTPYDVFIKALYEYFQGRLAPAELGQDSGLDLATFQQEGLHEAIRLLDRHGGVLVADAVGLGKTFIGLGLLEHYLIGERRRGNIPRGLVICPAQLRNTVWEPKLAEYQIAATVLSMEEMGRRDFPWQAYRNFDFVLVDESHNFRNRATGRYSNLFRLLSTGKRTKRVALLTATPINNTIWDLYHQIMLLTKGQEDYYRDYGIPNLRGFFARVDKNAADLFNLLEETTVRRSRGDIKRRQAAGERVIIGGKEVRFPDRTLAAVTYDLDGTYAGFYRAIADDIERLTLVSYNIEQFRKDATKTTIDRNNAIIGLLKTLFLKRLESSVSAFETSVRWQQQFQQRFYDTLVGHNRLLDSARYRQLAALLGGAAALEDDEAAGVRATVEETLADLPPARAAEYDLPAIKARLADDLAIFDGLIARLDTIRRENRTGTAHDDKLEQVKAALATPPLHGQKVLIFSYYEQTARYLYESLSNDPAWHAAAGAPRLALITGRNTPSERKALITRFAPQANADPLLTEPGLGVAEDRPSPGAEIDILISTDVLSEGQNLQDAGIVLNYDLHWNPVRMIQRAGRIDRVGSPHAHLRIYNCFPEAELEQLLGLVGRLQERIAAIGRNLGNDASILGEVVAEKSLEDIKRLRSGDPTVVAALESQEDAWLGGDEMRLPLLAYLQELGESQVQEIPLGIHSGRGNQPLRGVFFAFRARDQHFWRFYEIEQGAVKGPPITDKRQLFRLIACPRSEARVVPAHQIWSYLETATKDILAELHQQQGTRRLRMPMTGLNLRLYNVLATLAPTTAAPPAIAAESGTAPTAEPPVVARLTTLMQEVSLKPFERDQDLRGVLASYTQTQQAEPLVAELDAFAAERDLYSAMGSTRPTFAAIQAEDLELVCYELFS